METIIARKALHTCVQIVNIFSRLEMGFLTKDGTLIWKIVRQTFTTRREVVSQMSDVLIQSINEQFVKTDKWNILTLQLKTISTSF